MFFLPHVYDSQNYLQEVGVQELSKFDNVINELLKDVSDEFTEFALTLMKQDNKMLPNNAYEGLELYI